MRRIITKRDLENNLGVQVSTQRGGIDRKVLRGELRRDEVVFILDGMEYEKFFIDLWGMKR